MAEPGHITFGDTYLPAEEVTQRVRRVARTILARMRVRGISLEDATQEGLVYVLSYRQRFDPCRASLEVFIDLVARSGILNYLRRYRRKVSPLMQLPEGFEVADRAPSPFDQVSTQERRDHLARAGLRLLTEREKRILTHRAADTTLKEIGAMERLSVERIRQLQAVAMDVLRESADLDDVAHDIEQDLKGGPLENY